jgi:hypothetical protein
MPSKSNEGANVVIDGLAITPQLVSELKDLDDFDLKEAKNILATNSLFICGSFDEVEHVDREFFSLLQRFYQLLSILESNKEGGPHA